MGRRFAAASLAVGLIVVAVASWALRRQIAESWHLNGLRSRDPTERAEALSALERVGGNRSVARLVRVLEEDEALRSRAADVLLAVFPRLTRRHAEDAAAGLREAALADDGRAAVALRTVGPKCPGIFHVLAEDVIAKRGSEFLAAAILFEGWPTSREEIMRVSSETSASRFQEIMSALVHGGFDWDEAMKPLSRSTFLEPARYLALHHEDPLVRAIGLSLGVVRSATGLADIDFDLLREVFEKDTHRLPRRAALRMAGYLGPLDGSLELDRIIREEKDPEFRREAIQARDLWSFELDAACDAVELWENVASVGLERGAFPPHPQPWTERELKSLEDILMSVKDPSLRDAASLALAGRQRRHIENPEIADEPIGASELVVHEWGVWKEGGGVLASMKAIEELPWFVHSSFSHVEEILRTDVGRSFQVLGVVMKPVVFFYYPKPLSVLLRVDFPEGRPWTFYPEATDYTPGFARTTPWEDTLAVHPPWLRACREEAQEEIEGVSKKGSGELSMRYPVARWVLPRRPQALTSWSGVGLEWCGLRVGYPAELELELEPPSGSPWWGFLRDVPSTPVAVRGDREKFVFYDGAVSAPSPLRVAWEDATCRALLLRADTAFIPEVFIIRKGPHGLSGRIVNSLSWDDPDSTVALESLDLANDELVTAFGETLRAEGLSAPEATSLVRTWTPEFFEAEGLRVITLLPRWMYDSMLPIRIAPVPGEIVRVGLVWRECDDLGIGF